MYGENKLSFIDETARYYPAQRSLDIFTREHNGDRNFRPAQIYGIPLAYTQPKNSSPPLLLPCCTHRVTDLKKIEASQGHSRGHMPTGATPKKRRLRPLFKRIFIDPGRDSVILDFSRTTTIGGH